MKVSLKEAGVYESMHRYSFLFYFFFNGAFQPHLKIPEDQNLLRHVPRLKPFDGSYQVKRIFQNQL